MLLLAAAAFAMPAVFQLAGGDGLPTVGPERIAFGSTVELLSGLIAGRLDRHLPHRAVLSLRTTGDVVHEPAYEDEGIVGLVGAHSRSRCWRSRASRSA